jgi:hypothetical protein
MSANALSGYTYLQMTLLPGTCAAAVARIIVSVALMLSSGAMHTFSFQFQSVFAEHSFSACILSLKRSRVVALTMQRNPPAFNQNQFGLIGLQNTCPSEYPQFCGQRICPQFADVSLP